MLKKELFFFGLATKNVCGRVSAYRQLGCRDQVPGPLAGYCDSTSSLAPCRPIFTISPRLLSPFHSVTLIPVCVPHNASNPQRQSQPSLQPGGLSSQLQLIAASSHSWPCIYPCIYLDTAWSDQSWTGIFGGMGSGANLHIAFILGFRVKVVARNVAQHPKIAVYCMPVPTLGSGTRFGQVYVGSRGLKDDQTPRSVVRVAFIALLNTFSFELPKNWGLPNDSGGRRLGVWT